MKSFSYANPTRILFGVGQIAAIAKQIPESARVLMTYGGGSIKANGVYDQVVAALGDREVAEFGGIEPNPSYETMMQAAAVARAHKSDFILAVGGGSVVDGSKFLAVALKHDGPDAWDLVTGKAKVKGAVPLGAVLTLPATGSESNSGAVITNKALGAKLPIMHPAMFPAFAVLDPETTRTLPPRQVANGVADAFVHVIEQYLTQPAGGMVQDAYAEALLRTLVAVGPKTLADPDDMDARANLMWAANQALNGRFSFGTGKINALAGFTSALILLAVAFGMVWESVARWLDPVAIAYGQAIAVAVIGLAVNGGSMLLLGEHDHDHDHHHDHHDHHDHDDHDHDHDHDGEDTNRRAAYVHVLTDALTSVLAIAALAAGWMAGAAWLDPLVAVLGAVLIARWAVGLIRDTAAVLLDFQGPAPLREKIRDAIMSDRDAEVADLHLWSIGVGRYAAEIMVIAAAPLPPEAYKQRLAGLPQIVHVGVEVHRCAGDH